MDMLRWDLGKHTPRAVVAIGGKYGVNDNREIPDTCEVHWDFGDLLIGFVQYNANAAPAGSSGAEMEIRGTNETLYIYSNRREVVPEKTTEVLFGARTPIDRTAEKAYNPSKKATLEPKVVNGATSTPPHCRNFLDYVKSAPAPTAPLRKVTPQPPTPLSPTSRSAPEASWNGTARPSGSLIMKPLTVF